MALTQEQERRRRRLKALLDHPEFGGVKAALGAFLGYKSGAFVRQLIEGERPISEKTVDLVHSAKNGKFAGWFDVDESEPGAPPPAEPWPFTAYITPDMLKRLSPEQRVVFEWEALKVLRAIQETARPFVAPSEKQPVAA